MKALLIKLESWGCDVKDALTRLMGDEDLLIDCIAIVEKDPAFQKLGEALKRADAGRRLSNRCTPSRGSAANTGLTPCTILRWSWRRRFGGESSGAGAHIPTASAKAWGV